MIELSIVEAFLKKHETQLSFQEAKKLVSEGKVTLIWRSDVQVYSEIDEDEVTLEVVIEFDEFGNLNPFFEITKYYLASLIHFALEFHSLPISEVEGKIYTREGMKRRVIRERGERAIGADYKIKLGRFLYGPHILMDDRKNRYDITIWDFNNYTGYIDNIDWKTNKIGTTKHIIYLIDYIKSNPSLAKTLKKSSQCIEIVPDPTQNYEVTYKYNGKISPDQETILSEMFAGAKHLTIEDLIKRLPIINKLQTQNDFVVRGDVYERLSWHFEQIEQQKLVAEMQNEKLDYSFLKIEPFNYQKIGIEFCVFKKGAIIADEMGLGKTIQAMSIAIIKRKYYDFKKTLIICPSSVKYQWKKEIEKFTDESPLIVEGFPNQRQNMYQSEDHFFFIINYETVLRDKLAIDKADFDFIILDEAQKIKNYETKVAGAVSALKKKHGLVITGTPIENKLIDLYSIMLFVDRYRMTPLWEFSYQHCIFDPRSKNKINGYYNLNELNSQLGEIMIRRQKKNVLKDLPSIIEQNVFVTMHNEQAFIHASMYRRLAQILAKKFKTQYDWDQIIILLTNMRRVCNSTYLIDKETNYSSKMVELEHILFDQLNLVNEDKKIIIFSEWLDSLFLVEQLLVKYKIGFTKLTGKVTPKKRSQLVKAFEENKDCKVFLSTEAGGAGLNLQVADTLINFELPWNPAKKNQRTGRIDRIGQSAKKLHIFNLLTKDGIEMHLASGLLLKQNLFESVLDDDNTVDTVDFSKQGRAQFIKQLEEMLLLDSQIDEELEVGEQALSEDLMPTDMVFEEEENLDQEDKASIEEINNQIPTYDAEKIEAIMNKGFEFLAGMYEMSTGKKLGGDGGHKVEIDKATGEVVFRFKL